MEYEVITLGDMIESIGEVKVKNIITDFKSIPGDRKNDVECFLHSKNGLVVMIMKLVHN